jgi:hypothetical protein
VPPIFSLPSLPPQAAKNDLATALVSRAIALDFCPKISYHYDQLRKISHFAYLVI